MFGSCREFFIGETGPGPDVHEQHPPAATRAPAAPEPYRTRPGRPRDEGKRRGSHHDADTRRGSSGCHENPGGGVRELGSMRGIPMVPPPRVARRALHVAQRWLSTRPTADFIASGPIFREARLHGLLTGC